MKLTWFNANILVIKSILLLLVSICLPASAKNDLHLNEFIIVDKLDYEVNRHLGDGAIGNVYLATASYYPNIHLAVKYFEWSKADDVYAFRRNILDGHMLVSRLDPNSTLFRFGPQLINVSYKGEIVADPEEVLSGTRMMISDQAAVMRLADSDLSKDLDRMEKDHKDTYADRLKLAERVLSDIIPELVHLASGGLVHGDVKLRNILSTKGGRYGLGDFDSVAKIGDVSLFGTRGYLAPEYDRGSTVNSPTRTTKDLYALAITMLEVLFPGNISKAIIKAENPEMRARYLKEGFEILDKAILRQAPNSYEEMRHVRAFILAGLETDPKLRAESVKVTKYGRMFKTPLYSEFSPIQILIFTMRLHNPETTSVASYLRELYRFPNLKAMLIRLAQDGDSVIEALRAAQILDMKIGNEKALLIAHLSKRPARSKNQMNQLKEFLIKCQCEDESIARALHRRFIQTDYLDMTIEPWVYDLVAKYRSVYEINQIWFEMARTRSLIIKQNREAAALAKKNKEIEDARRESEHRMADYDGSPTIPIGEIVPIMMCHGFYTN